MMKRLIIGIMGAMSLVACNQEKKQVDDKREGINYSNDILKPKPRSSCNNTLRDSGSPGVGIASPLTIASYAFERPTTSSDLIVRIS